MMLETLRREIIEEYIRAYNNFDVKGMVKNVSENIEFKNTEDGVITLTTNGIQEFKEVAAKAQDFFEKRRQTILDFEFGSNFVIIYINFEAILAQDINENLKAGDSFKVGGKSIFTFKDEQIISIEDYS